MSASAAWPDQANFGEAVQVHQRVALTGDPFVELDDDLGHRALLSHRDHCIGDCVEVAQILAPQRVANARLGEQPPASSLSAKMYQSRIGAVHRDTEHHGDIPLEFCGVVRNEVRPRRVRDERRDSAEKSWPLEQFLAERAGGPVTNRHECQPGPGEAVDHVGEQR